MLAPISLALSVLHLRARDEAAIIAEANSFEALYGPDAIARVRDQIALAERTERARLYRIHDQIARRRADGAANPAAGARLQAS